MAGRVIFTADKPYDTTPTDGSTAWYDELWNGCAHRSGKDSHLSGFLFFIAQDVKEKVPSFKTPVPDEHTLINILAAAGIGVVLAGAGVVTLALLPLPLVTAPIAGGVYGIKKLYDYMKARRLRK